MRADRIFAALGDRTRLRLVDRLGARGRLSILELARGASVTRQAVTKHLRVLEEAGLVRSAWEGRENVFELDRVRLRQAQDFLELRARQWDAALARLAAFVEK